MVWIFRWKRKWWKNESADISAIPLPKGDE